MVFSCISCCDLLAFGKVFAQCLQCNTEVFLIFMIKIVYQSCKILPLSLTLARLFVHKKLKSLYILFFPPNLHWKPWLVNRVMNWTMTLCYTPSSKTNNLEILINSVIKYTHINTNMHPHASKQLKTHPSTHTHQLNSACLLWHTQTHTFIKNNDVIKMER